jgi:hypothetical protein
VSFRAIIKTATAKKQKRLRREREARDRRAIYQSRHIRSLYDEINQYISENCFHGDTAAFEEIVQSNPYCLVLEYLDVPLSALDPTKYKDNPVFMTALFEGTLGGVKDVGLTKNVWMGESGRPIKPERLPIPLSRIEKLTPYRRL